MKDIMEYFNSPTKMVSPTTKNSAVVDSSSSSSSLSPPQPPPPTVLLQSTSSTTTTTTISTPHHLPQSTKQTTKPTSGISDVALIVSNMKSVISAVNHKNRKRRKHHRGTNSNNNSNNTTADVKLINSQPSSNEPAEISDISNILSNSLSFRSTNISKNSDILDGTESLASKSSPKKGLSSMSLLLNDKNTTITNMDNIKQKSTSTSDKLTVTTGNKTIISMTNTKDSNINATSLPKHENPSPKKRHSKENKSHKLSTTKKVTKKSIDSLKNGITTTSSSSSSSSTSSVQIQSTDKTPTSITPKKNAFDLLMSARNKVIGSNSPASVSKMNQSPPPPSPPIVVDTTKIKRKLMLEDWADRKGGEKRKIQDMEKSAYIDQQMNRRAKRLKRLLQNGHRQKKDNAADADDDVDDLDVNDDDKDNNDNSSETPFIKLNFKKKNDKSKTKKSIKKSNLDNSLDSSNLVGSSSVSSKYKPLELVVTTKTTNEIKTLPISPPTAVESTKQKQNSSFLKTPTKQQKLSTNSRSSSSSSNSNSNGVAGGSESKNDNSFISKLSSPLKKRDSLLGYFNKVSKTPSPNISLEITINDNQADDGDDDLVEVVVEVVEQPSIPSPKSINKEETKTNVNKRNTKRKTKTIKQLSGQFEIEKSSLKSPNKQIENRPKRQCRNKIISYQIETQSISPVKLCAQKSLKRAKRILSVSSSGGDCSPVKSTRKSLTTAAAKLAPIFCGKLPKPVVDLERLQARQNFLMSGIPEKMKLDIERQRQYEETFECDAELFPLISHVTQLNAVDTIRWRQQQTQYPPIKYRDEPLDDVVVVSDKVYDKFQCGKNCTPIKKITIQTKQQQQQQRVEPNFSIQKKLIRHLKKKDLTKFLYFRCYKQLRKKFIQAKMNDQENGLKKSSTKSSQLIILNDDESDDDKLDKMPSCGKDEEEIDDDDDDDVQFVSDTSNNSINSTMNTNEIMLFTEKYQPKLSDEILVNSAPAIQLKKFLSTWQESNMVRREKKRRYNSSDDSDNDDNDAFSSNSGVNSEQQTLLRNAICLLGPSGCGKTMTVYSLANELNFKVLEINAGCKRTGKKILQELQEATQSHHVKGNGNGGGGASTTDKFFKITQTSQSDESNSFTGASSAVGTPSSGSLSNNSQKLSLILIEDADIVFEQDFGFIEAISQLITTSKRPVILALNQQNCVHLAKFLAYNTINFVPPNPEQIGKWLSTLSIVEHCYVNAKQCQQLYRKNDNDLRKTILELQFFIQTFGDNSLTIQTNSLSRMQEHKSLNNTFNKNNNSSYHQDFNLITNKNSLDLIDQRRKMVDNNCSLDELAKLYDNLSTTEVLQRKQSSLGDDDGLVINNGKEIIRTIIDGELYKPHDNIHMNVLLTNGSSIKNNTIIPKKLLAERILSNINNPPQTSGGAVGSNVRVLARRKSINLDVEPCLRAICRSEQFRTQLDQRSSRRFYHYLRNSMTTTTFSLNIFDEYCTIFQSKTTTNDDDRLLDKHKDSNNTDASS